MNKKKKEIPDYQLDLTPFISLLSVCICFLLLTVTWFQVGALSVKQALGQKKESHLKQEDPIQLWVYMRSKKQLEVSVKKGGKTLSQKKIHSTEVLDWNVPLFKKHIKELKTSHSHLEEVFVLPTANTLYENIITVMDTLRQEGLVSIGLTSL